MFTIEVVASTLQSCISAQKGGARRIELCSALATAGVTPSAGLIQLVKQYVTIPVVVMIRPREGDFCYSHHEYETMKRDIQHAKVMGADGVVLGLLSRDGTVNSKMTYDLVQVALPMKVTFHRAIDIVPDIFEAMEAVMTVGCERILTSGGKKTGVEGIEIIREMANRAGDKIAIMPGGGITAESLSAMLTANIHDYHLSGRVAVSSPIKTDVFEMNYAETDAAIIKSVVKKAKEFFMPA
ncbi:MAG: copper homeostasis protein CutC [Flavobacteriales bacterium]|nr:copper homeostasis protein CutC [Flavobacteriales bacterium]